MVLHGYPRFTADLVIALEPENTQHAIEALQQLGFRPRAPVPLAAFADPDQRKSWIDDKDLIVLSLWSPQMPLTEIDLFVREPFPFDETFARASRMDLGEVSVSIASIDDLIELKRAAGRPKDLDDIRALESLRDDQ